MILDLGGVQRSAQELRADVLVIGAGIAGLLMSTRLAHAGKQVIVVESGGRFQIDETHPLNEVEQIGDLYSGAEHGRFRCLGGTSTRWGGAMLPFLPSDMAKGGQNGGWPIELHELTSYQREIEDLFRLGQGPYEFPELLAQDNDVASSFIPRLAKWPPFRLRNVATLLKGDIESKKGPEIWLNATATDFAFGPGGRLASVKMQSPNGNQLTVRAEETIIASGAIESTRLLLLADRQHSERIFAPDKVLGRYFHDHLSIPAAKLFEVQTKALNRLIGFRFENKVMRNLRFEVSGAFRAKNNCAAGFVHIGFSTGKPSGFDALRDVFRTVQKRELPKPADAAALARALPWLSRAVWWRLVENRLLFPAGANFGVHVVVEQQPRADNRISLSERRADVYGCPLARIDWRVHDQDAAHIVLMTHAFMATWGQSGLSKLARIELNMPDDPKQAIVQSGGIYHPGGSTRMAAGASQGVVDRDLRTFRVPNLSVVSTSVFPAGGGANPTMMLMMAALRAASRIARL